jgi:hypothetical protein
VLAGSHWETRVILACGSFLAFAGLTAFIGTRYHEPDTQTDTTAPGSGSVVDSQDGAGSAQSGQEASGPAATTRGT